MDLDGQLYAKLFVRAPVYDLIFSCLSPRSLVCFALTCRTVYFAVVEFKARAFNINRHFSRHFTDPVVFRSLQAKTNTLVSGSNALQFFDRSFYPEADLDLYTHPGHSLEVAQFLIESEGYRYVPRELQNEDLKQAIAPDWEKSLTQKRIYPHESDQPYPTMYIKGVWTFEKAGVNGGQSLKVQIVEARSSPLEAILGFHSTCVMNFISSEAAYSLCPIATFEDRTSLAMPSSQFSPQAIVKYMRRGWRVYIMPTPDNSAFLLNQVRWVGDKHTWKIPLDQTGVKERLPLSQNAISLKCDPALFQGWKFRLRPKPEENDDEFFQCYECHYYPLRSTLFRYNYAIPDETLQLAIRNWTVPQGNYNHLHVPKEDWVWFDADIPSFFSAK